jgi:hypothetical protein
MTWRVLCVILLLLPAGAHAGSDDHGLLAQASAAFQNGIRARGTPQEVSWFQKAAAACAELRQRGFQSPALCLDEGNACLLANDLPGAILAYRRGLQLAPNDRHLRFGLEYARAQVAYPTTGALGRQPIERWPPWLPRPTLMTGWFVLFCLYAAVCVLLARWWMTRRRSLLVSGGICAILSVILGLGLVWLIGQQRGAAEHPLVVIAQDDVYLRKGNGALYERRYDTPLPRGVEAQQRCERNGWMQIELADGAVGWVPRSAVRQ